jgi:uncharacterized protein (DUF1684 family)
MLDLLAWRRDVFELYSASRALPPGDGHERWRAGRDRLFRTSPQSPLPPGDARRTEGLPVAAYDPAWRVVVPLEPAEPTQRTAPAGTDGEVVMDRVGVLRTPWGVLDAWWLRGYAGGLFVPVRDASAGAGSYGGGRYLLDTVKGADLGNGPDGVVVDLNFLYHPSCAYSPAWVCPLAGPGNTLNRVVPVGERLPVTK